MKIQSLRKNQTVHTATVDETIAHRAVAEHVAAQVGVDLNAAGVAWRAYTSSRDTSTGFKHDVGVEIIVNHGLADAIKPDDNDSHKSGGPWKK